MYLYAVTRNQTAVYNLRTNSKVAPSSEHCKCFSLIAVLLPRIAMALLCLLQSAIDTPACPMKSRCLQALCVCALMQALVCCARQAVLDEMGAERGATALDSDGQLVVARPEAVYFYTPDGRGPCFVFEGALACLPCRTPIR